MIIVGRPINGIPLNGLEYLMDSDGMDMRFNTEADATAYLVEHGVTGNALEEIIFKEDGRRAE